MARIRSIKPEFPQSESMGRVSRDARLTFIELWTLADDEGRLRGNSRMLASLLFPYDDDAPGLITAWLDELDLEGCIVRYLDDGDTYIQICNWLNHQKIDRPSQSKIPAFDEGSRVLANDHRRIKEGIKDQGRDQGVEGKGVEGVPPKKTLGLDALLKLGVDEQAGKDWLTVRKAKHAPLTQSALDDLTAEALRAEISVAQAVAICAKRSWQGFNSTWDWQGKGKTNGQGAPPSFKTAKQAEAEKFVQEATGRGRSNSSGNTIEGQSERIAGSMD